MDISLINFGYAADIISASEILLHDDRPSSLRLDLLHPVLGMVSTIQPGGGSEVYLIQDGSPDTVQVPAP
ncbi:hypothetical protein GXW78_24020 [Roseomonas terrae]|uniref:Uncharacterized protein n=1 Tax=Neoroseomonas terrae TaxID=424799 RepID=A0ABS5EP76_9PROT|nr:hypothetical protein [Neoroseomonas terrae]MBR0652745.1 hypothetical protein [Neoroseomonas terrae]